MEKEKKKKEKKPMTPEESEMTARFSEELAKIKVPKNSIAEKVEFSAQTFTNITKGRNLPGLLLLHKISYYFPEFDPAYVITGIRKGEDSSAVKNLQYQIDIKDAVIRNLVGMSEKPEKLGKTKVAIKSSDAIKRHQKLACEKVTKSISKGRVGLLPGRYFYGNVTLRQSGI